MKVNNLHKVLEYIIIFNEISRADLSRYLSLNKATVSYLTNELEELKIIVPKDELKKTNGRHSVLYELNKDYAFVISINIKPKCTQIYVTSLKGEIVISENLDNKIQTSLDLLKTVSDITKKYTKLYPNNLGIGVGIHGLISSNSKIKFAPYNNIKNYNLLEELNSIFPEQNFYIKNEANVTALGESKILDEETAITITNSKGIGAGIVIENNVYGGASGYAGEIGHTIVEPNGLLCPCGNKGCLEQYASEENLFAKASEIKNVHINYSSFKELFLNNDEDIKNIYFTSLDYLSIAINNVINLLNPSTIILNSELYSDIASTIDYISLKIPNQIDKVNIFTNSTLQDKAFAIGFTKLITHDYFINEIKWDLK